jgi:hypothetical protein
VAWFKDPDGNVLSVTDVEPNLPLPRRSSALEVVGAPGSKNLPSLATLRWCSGSSRNAVGFARIPNLGFHFILNESSNVAEIFVVLPASSFTGAGFPGSVA